MRTDPRNRYLGEKSSTYGYKVAESSCFSSLVEAVEATDRIGYPVLCVRPLDSRFGAYAGGKRSLVQGSLAFIAQVNVDKSLKGWKELDFEVVWHPRV